ncbi:MAG TPA: branched-chain amino acid ABC transporter permease [Firmicutes bacterium]|nr:branched-chain amino acid ABC transporter permease [Bacillota bacterium]
MFLTQLVHGLTLGACYALIALGYSMVYGIIGLINFAHGDIYMLGSFFALYLTSVVKMKIAPAFLIAMGLTSLVGLVIERVAYKPLRRSGRLSPLISAIGVSIFLSTLLNMYMGPQTRGFPDVITELQVKLGEIVITTTQLYIVAMSIALMLLLRHIVMRTRVGQAMRACSWDREVASLMGINVDQIIALTFAIGSALAAAAGVMMGVYFNAWWPLMGFSAGIKAFTAAVLGGIGSIPGAMLGGVVLGLVEILGSAYLQSSYRDAISFTILIIVLLVRPSGLLGRKIEQKV